MRWFFLVLDDEQVGPLTPEEIEERVNAGEAVADTPYWEEGLDDWMPLSELVPELAQEAPAEGVHTAPVEAFVAPSRPVPVMPAPGAAAAGYGAGAVQGYPGGMGHYPSPGQMTAMHFRQQGHRERVGGRLLFAGWLCGLLALGAGVFFRSPVFLILMLVLQLAAVGLAIGGMTMRRVGEGILLLVVALLLPAGLVLTMKAYNLTPFGLDFAGRVDAGDGQRVVFNDDAEIIVRGGQVIVRGSLRNASRVPMPGLEVVLEQLDNAGNTVATASAPVLTDVAIPAGGEVRYEVTAPEHPEFKKVSTFARLKN